MAAKGVLFKKFEYESNLWDKGLERVAGVDEVGRGPQSLDVAIRL